MAVVAPLLGNIAINLAVGVATSALASALQPKQKTRSQTVTTTKGFSFELQVGEGVAVSAVFGLGRATGQLIYVNEYGDDNEYVQLVIKVGHGWHDGMEAFLLDEKPVTFSGSNGSARGRSIDEFTVEGTPYGWVKYYTGAPGQAADPELVARANPSSRWTSHHKMTGCAYYILTFRYNADLFGSTLPLSGSIWRGLRLYDWREADAVWGDQSTYVFTKNPAVIRYNFRRGIYVNGVRILGQGFSAFANDLAGYTAAANRCDEEFYDPETDTTFPIFEYGREIGDDEEKLSVLTELDAAYCGSSFKRGGADVPLPAQQLVSVLTLTDADRLRGNPVRADKKGSVSAKKTMWHGQFVSEDIGWAMAPFTPRINEDLESVLGGRRSVALDQPYESLQQRAQLRAEIALRRQFYPATRVETFTPKAFVLEPGDPVTRVCDWGNVLMVVEKVERVMVDDRWIGVTVTMSQWNNAIVPASGDSFIDLPKEPGGNPANPNRTIAVSGLTVVGHQREGGGAEHPYAKASWVQITDPNVDQVMIRVWPSDGTEEDDREDFFANAHLQNVLIFGPLQPETEYTYKAIPVRSDARLCVWTNTGTFVTGVEGMPLGDETVTYAKLAAELVGLNNWVTTAIGAAQDEVDRLSELVAGASSNTAYTADQLRRALTSTSGDITAAYSEAITTLAGEVDGQLIGLSSRIEELQVQIDDDIAEAIDRLTAQITEIDNKTTVNLEAITALNGSVDGTAGGAIFKMGVDYDPASGWDSRIGFQVRSDASDAFSDAGLFLESKDGLGRILASANQFAIVAPNGNVLSLFDADSGTVYIDNARIRDLDADNIDVDALTSSSGFFDNLSVTSAMIANAAITNAKIATGAITSAKIGDLAVDRLKLAEGSVTDFNNDSGSGGPTGGSGVPKTEYGSNFVAPDYPFIVGGSGTVSAGGGSSPFTSVQLIIQDRVTDDITILDTATGSASATLRSVKLIGFLTPGRNYRLGLRFTGSSDGGGGPGYGAWSVQSMIQRK